MILIPRAKPFLGELLDSMTTAFINLATRLQFITPMA
jgi:hypothetical protein